MAAVIASGFGFRLTCFGSVEGESPGSVPMLYLSAGTTTPAARAG
jgi:hypothetical protein